MFYSQVILAKKGPLAKIWLAAHFEKKLTKQQIYQTDITSSVEQMINNETPLALRVSGHLMLGLVRIYSKKMKYLMIDCTDAMWKMQLAWKGSAGDQENINNLDANGNDDPTTQQLNINSSHHHHHSQNIDDNRYFGNISMDLGDFPILDNLAFVPTMLPVGGGGGGGAISVISRGGGQKVLSTPASIISTSKLGGGNRFTQEEISQLEGGRQSIETLEFGRAAASRGSIDASGGRLSTMSANNNNNRLSQQRSQQQQLGLTPNKSQTSIANRFEDDLPVFDVNGMLSFDMNNALSQLPAFEPPLIDTIPPFPASFQNEDAMMIAEKDGSNEREGKEIERVNHHLKKSFLDSPEFQFLAPPLPLPSPSQGGVAGGKPPLKRRKLVDEKIELSEAVIKQRMADTSSICRRKPNDPLPFQITRNPKDASFLLSMNNNNGFMTFEQFEDKVYNMNNFCSELREIAEYAADHKPYPFPLKVKPTTAAPPPPPSSTQATPVKSGKHHQQSHDQSSVELELGRQQPHKDGTPSRVSLAPSSVQNTPSKGGVVPPGRDSLPSFNDGVAFPDPSYDASFLNPDYMMMEEQKNQTPSMLKHLSERGSAIKGSGGMGAVGGAIPSQSVIRTRILETLEKKKSKHQAVKFSELCPHATTNKSIASRYFYEFLNLKTNRLNRPDGGMDRFHDDKDNRILFNVKQPESYGDISLEVEKKPMTEAESEEFQKRLNKLEMIIQK